MVVVAVVVPGMVIIYLHKKDNTIITDNTLPILHLLAFQGFLE